MTQTLTFDFSIEKRNQIIISSLHHFRRTRFGAFGGKQRNQKCLGIEDSDNSMQIVNKRANSRDPLNQAERSHTRRSK